MGIRWLHRERCLTPYKFLLFALIYCLTCVICMTLLYDIGASTQVKVKPKSDPTLKPSRTFVSKGDSSWTPISSGRGISFDQRDKIRKKLFNKGGLDSTKGDYRSLLGNKTVHFQCNQCAIVSSSGQLLGTGAGRHIDSNDCVIRMNNAPTKGYEDDVGSRTTVRVIGHVNLRRIFANNLAAQEEFLSNASTKSDHVFFHWSFLTDIDKDPPVEYNEALDLARKYPNVSFNFFTPEKMKYAENLFYHETGLTRSQANTWLSTGWYTMLLAIDSCKQINIYGMVYDSYCKEHPDKKVPYHYYDLKFKSECKYYHVSEVRLTSGHLFMTEKAVFGRWAKIHNIQFLYPRWPHRHISLSSQGLQTPFVQRYQIAQNRLFSKMPIWKLFFHFSGLFYPLVH